MDERRRVITPCSVIYTLTAMTAYVSGCVSYVLLLVKYGHHESHAGALAFLGISLVLATTLYFTQAISTVCATAMGRINPKYVLYFLFGILVSSSVGTIKTLTYHIEEDITISSITCVICNVITGVVYRILHDDHWADTKQRKTPETAQNQSGQESVSRTIGNNSSSPTYLDSCLYEILEGNQLSTDLATSSRVPRLTLMNEIHLPSYEESLLPRQQLHYSIDQPPKYSPERPTDQRDELSTDSVGVTHDNSDLEEQSSSPPPYAVSDILQATSSL